MPRVRCLIAPPTRKKVDIYTVDEAEFKAAQDRIDHHGGIEPSRRLARWVKRHGDLMYTTPYQWAYAVGGER